MCERFMTFTAALSAVALLTGPSALAQSPPGDAERERPRPPRSTGTDDRTGEQLPNTAVPKPTSPAARRPRPPYYSPGAAAGFSALGIGAAAYLLYRSADDNEEGMAFFAITVSLFSPSAGHWYTGDTGRAWTGVGLRSASALLFFVAIGAENEILGIGSIAAYLGVTAYNLVDAPFSAVRMTRRARRQWRLAPTVIRDVHRRRATGLSLIGRF